MPYRRRRSRIVRSGIPRSAPTCREVRPPCAYNKAKTSDRSVGSPGPPQWSASASAARPKRHSRPAQNPGDALPPGTCQLGDAVGRQPFALIQMRKSLKTHLVLPGHRIGARRAARTRPRRWRHPCRARTRVHEFTVDLKHAASHPLGRDRWRGTAVNGDPSAACTSQNRSNHSGSNKPPGHISRSRTSSGPQESHISDSGRRNPPTCHPGVRLAHPDLFSWPRPSGVRRAARARSAPPRARGQSAVRRSNHGQAIKPEWSATPRFTC